ncbi:TolC family protein [Riemerella anatipestifer]|uniref:TolC family protein n=1 Tax=Riemerella anatipestifer TaxID=34085 RepID=UPI00129D4647|nr:TolC family protein [Riemerella anatipestifer]MRM83095.1 TolC family protein [Riemerella anatipestifer]
MKKIFINIGLFALMFNLNSCLLYKDASKEKIDKLKETSIIKENVEIPENWILDNTADAEDFSYNWITELNNPQLTSLIQEGIKYNTDIVIAEEKLNQIELSMNIAGSNLYPSVNAIANTSNNLTNGSNIQKLGVQANWELDILGKNKANKMASVSNYFSAKYINERLKQTIAGMIVKAYFLNIAGNMQEAKVNQYIELTQNLEKIYTIQNKVGTANALDISNIKSELILLNGYLEKIKNANTQSKRTLELLIGKYPEGKVTTSDNFYKINSKVPTSFPLSLLENRPDILAKHYQIEKLFYEVQSTKFSRLPSISIGSTLGGANTNVLAISSLFSNPLVKVGGSLTTPIFNGGQLKTNVEIKNSEQQIAIEEYSKTVLNALNEMESSWSNTLSIEKQLEYNIDAITEMTKNIELTKKQIQIGTSNNSDLIQKQRNLLKIEIKVIDLELQERIERINLYLALGAPNFKKMLE